jgi:leader peptidase (prepilin peptidase) / N-methyltransferase
VPVLIATVALLGLAVGSFLNVVIHRVPRNESLIRPGSRCPNCESAIRVRHNVPVLGWLLLRGKCADCAEPISVRYPVVEIVTTALFVLTASAAAGQHLLAALPALLLFVAAGIALAAIDLDVMRLPNAIVYPSYGALAVLLSGAALAEHTAAPLLRAAVGGAVLFLGFLTLALIVPGGMGFGDVKLAGLVGVVLGFVSYPAIAVGAFAAFFLGAVAGIALILKRSAGRKSLVPFGPAMIAGALIAIFATAPVVETYSSLVHRA